MSRAARIREGYARAQEITRARAKSFWFASHALDRDAKRSAYALYALCRRADDVVDAARPGEDVSVALGALRARVEAAYDGEDGGDPILAAFGDTARSHAVPKAAVLDLLRGMEFDLVRKRYRSWDELDEYCDLAAGTVGRMMAAVFGVDDASALEGAAAMGRAMQLTNVLRDVREDLVEHDRVYLPDEALAAAGVDEAALRTFAARGRLEGPLAEPMRAVLREGARRAEALYARGDEDVPRIVTATGRACVRLMRATYSEILGALARQGWDPFLRRASTSTLRKLRASARAFAEARP
jgi:phytoene synthase